MSVNSQMFKLFCVLKKAVFNKWLNETTERRTQLHSLVVVVTLAVVTMV